MTNPSSATHTPTALLTYTVMKVYRDVFDNSFSFYLFSWNRKGLSVEKVPAEKTGDLIVPQIYLKRTQNSGFLYVRGREDGQGKRWDPRKGWGNLQINFSPVSS